MVCFLNDLLGQAEAKLVVFHGDLPYTSTAILKGLEKLGEKDVIGSGGYGTVYRLIMDDGVSFAVKRIAVCGSSSDRAFEGELEILGCFKHRNLVNLRGFCNSPLTKLLIYDYLPNGNLDEKLHGESSLVFYIIKNCCFIITFINHLMVVGSLLV